MPCGTIAYCSNRCGLLAVNPSTCIGAGRDIDSTPPRDHEVLLARQHAHGGEVDGLLARAAEAVERHARARRVSQPASSAAMRAMSIEWSPDAGAAAHDHVVDLARCRSPMRSLQRVQHLGEDALRVDRVQRPGLLALATRGADGVDDERFAGLRHGDLQVGRVR